jgi:hypothetical protein
MGKPRRISGVEVKETGESKWCKKTCHKEQPTVKAITRIGSGEYVTVFCSVCERVISCYKMKREPRKTFVAGSIGEAMQKAGSEP